MTTTNPYYTRVNYDPTSKFQMFSPEGNAAVDAMVKGVFDHNDATNGTRLDVINAMNKAVRALAEVYPEVHDSEPEWAIADAVNAYFDVKGWVHTTRLDVC